MRALKDLDKVVDFRFGHNQQEKAEVFIQELFSYLKVLESNIANFTELGKVDDFFANHKFV